MGRGGEGRGGEGRGGEGRGGGRGWRLNSRSGFLCSSAARFALRYISDTTALLWEDIAWVYKITWSELKQMSLYRLWGVIYAYTMPPLGVISDRRCPTSDKWLYLVSEPHLKTRSLSTLIRWYQYVNSINPKHKLWWSDPRWSCLLLPKRKQCCLRWPLMWLRLVCYIHTQVQVCNTNTYFIAVLHSLWCQYKYILQASTIMNSWITQINQCNFPFLSGEQTIYINKSKSIMRQCVYW